MQNPPVPRRLVQLPPIDAHTVALVRDSCVRLPVDGTVLTREFYTCLFEMAPQAREMFPVDMTTQHDRLLQALLAAVGALTDPAALEPRLRAWGAWHRHALGVTDDMYVYVGHALVRALRRVLGPVETSVGSAWIAVYEWLAATMIDGADEAGHRAPPGRSAVGVLTSPGGVDAPFGVVLRDTDREQVHDG